MPERSLADEICAALDAFDTSSDPEERAAILQKAIRRVGAERLLRRHRDLEAFAEAAVGLAEADLRLAKALIDGEPGRKLWTETAYRCSECGGAVRPEEPDA